MASASDDDTIQGTPPSFVPSSSRRRRSSGMTDGSTPHLPSVPPSYAPADRRRNAPSSTGSTGLSASGTSARIAQRIAGEPDRNNLRPRRSSGSSRHGGAAVLTATDDARPSTPPAPSKDTLSSSAARASRHPRRHRVLGIVLKSAAALLVVLLTSGFLLWHWVDGRLNKADWLTDTPHTGGTSWLILGSDERDGGKGNDGITGYRTDTIMVLTKPAQGPSSLISIPRDSLVSVEGSTMKINAVSQAYGQRQLVREVEDITDMKIDHVLQLRFGGLKNIVDALGGIDLCYDQSVDDPYSGLNWQAGCHHADGGTALAFSRMRYADAQSDFGRAARQRQVIGAIVKKGLDSSTLTNIPTMRATADATLDALSVDGDTNPGTLISMTLAFRQASGDEGVNGSVYWTNPDYYVDGVGSSVLLDEDRNHTLFRSLAAGTHQPGTVGSLTEGQ